MTDFCNWSFVSRGRWYFMF